MIKIALFGAGRIGVVHAVNAAAHPQVMLKYIVDPFPSDHATQLAESIGAVFVDEDTVFSDPYIGGVIIASSTDSHAALLLKAVQSAKPIFCEKPISLRYSEVREVARQVEASNVPCMLGFQRRYDPSFRAVRERLSDGSAGNLEQIIMTTRDPSPPPIDYIKVSGGMFRDQAIHDFDVARYLLGEEIKTVYAAGSCLIDPAIEQAGDIDTAMITLTTYSGCLVQMVNSRRAPFGFDQRLEVLCSKEMLSVVNQPESSMMIADSRGFTSARPESYFIERYSAGYRFEMFAFIDMIIEGKEPLAGIKDGLEAQRLAEAALVSFKTGQVVDLGSDWMP